MKADEKIIVKGLTAAQKQWWVSQGAKIGMTLSGYIKHLAQKGIDEEKKSSSLETGNEKE